MELGEWLRFCKGGYSLSLKFNVANEFSCTSLTKRKTNSPFIKKMPDMFYKMGKYIFCPPKLAPKKTES